MSDMKRVPIIDFVRYASILVVIGNHFYPNWIASFTRSSFLRHMILTFFPNGAYGVTCFFVVSGFLITQMLVANLSDFSKLDLKTFYVRRAARIIPLLLVIILAGLLMEQFIGLFDEKILKYNVWKDATGFGWPFWTSLFSFTFNWYLIGGQYGNGLHWNVLWSLAVEEQFYLCYPLIVKYLRDRKRVLTFLGIVVFSAVVFRLCALSSFQSNGFLMHQGSFGAFDQIAIGAFLYFANEQWGHWLDRHRKMASLLMFAGGTGCFYLFTQTSFENGNQYVVVPTLVALCCALVILGGLHIPVFESKTAHFLSWPGKLSYGCYLWHASLIVFLMPVLVSLGGLLAFICLVGAVSFFAFLSYRYFEVPANHRIRAWFKLKPSLNG
jgi:peptidoglycan/LPS O-acetylase OafA/YrhL